MTINKTCPHGVDINNITCFDCERKKQADKQQEQRLKEAKKRVYEQANKLDW